MILKRHLLMPSKRFGFLMAALLGLLFSTAPIVGQTAVQLALNHTEASDNGATLLLEMVVTVEDELLPAGPGPALQSAAVLLEDGQRAEARIEKSPAYVALLLDGSGSMRQVAGEIRQAAIEAINAAPPEVQLAVIRFDERIEFLQPFTNNHDLLIDAVNRFEAGDKGTCLYNVTHTALRSLAQIVGAGQGRMLVLFSDGHDEIRQGSGVTCSQSTFEQVVELANGDLPGSIHTIGLANRPALINEEGLERLATATGGMTAVGDAAASDLLRRVMSEAGNQWLVQADLYPGQGYQRGSLLVSLEDGRLPPPLPLTFVAYRSYVVPLEPVTIELSNFVYNEPADNFFFDVFLTNFRQADQLRVEVVDSRDNLQVARFTQDVIWEAQQIKLESDALAAEGSYRVNVVPLGSNGRPIAEAASHTFRYTPPVEPAELLFRLETVRIKDDAPRLNLRTLRFEDDQPELILAFLIENGEAVAQAEGYLIDQGGNRQAAEFALDIQPNNSARVPLNAAGGRYLIVVNALDEAGQPLATTGAEFNYVVPDGPFLAAANALQAHPLIALLALPLFLLLALIAWRLGIRTGRRRAGAVRQRPEPVWTADDPEWATTAVTAAIPAVELRVVETPDATLLDGRPLPVNQFPYSIGREDCDLTIADRHISRKHAQLLFENGRFYVEDMGSSNGTFVNEAPLAAQKRTPLSVDAGVRIRIGKTTHLTFSEVTPASEMAAPGEIASSAGSGLDPTAEMVAPEAA